MRILIADDHDLLRDTLDLWFRQEQIEVTSVRDLPTAIAAIEEVDPFDLVLLDYGMPGMNGLSGLQRVLDEGKNANVALMSGIAERDVAERALALGAMGFLPKSLPAKTFVNAVRFMALGEQYVPIDFMTSAPDNSRDHPLAEKLTPRELNVLRYLCEGHSNKEIARELGLQEATVKLHVTSLYRKVGVRNRTQAALIAKEAGLF